MEHTLTAVKEKSRFANVETPIAWDEVAKIPEDQLLVLKNSDDKEVAINIHEAVEHMLAHGLKDPFVDWWSAYTDANAQAVRNHPHPAAQELKNQALIRTLQAEQHYESGDLPEARKLVGSALQLAPQLMEALALSRLLADGPAAPRPSAPAVPAAARPAPSAPNFFARLFSGAQPRRAARSLAPATRVPPLPPAAQHLGIPAATLGALRSLARAIETDATSDNSASFAAMQRWRGHAQQLTPAVRGQIDAHIQIYGHPFSQGFRSAFEPNYRLGGRRVGFDDMGSELGAALSRLG